MPCHKLTAMIDSNRFYHQQSGGYILMIYAVTELNGNFCKVCILNKMLMGWHAAENSHCIRAIPPEV